MDCPNGKFLNALVIDEEFRKGNVISWKEIYSKNSKQFKQYGLDCPEQLRDRFRSQIHKKRNKTPRSTPNKAPEQQKRRRNLWSPARDIFLYYKTGGNVND